MSTASIKGIPPEANSAPFRYVPETIALNKGVPTTTAVRNRVESEWRKARTQMFAGKYQKQDSEDLDVVGHMNWYFSTNFTRPYPAEKKVRRPNDFPNLLVLRDA